MDFIILAIIVAVIYYWPHVRACRLAVRGMEKYEREDVLDALVAYRRASAIIANRFRWRTVL